MRFDELFDLYYNQHVIQHCSRKRDVERSFALYFTPLSDKEISDISRIAVQAWVNRLGADKGRATANRQFNTLRAVLRWGERLDLFRLDPDPTKYVNTFRTKARKKFLKREEYTRFRDALDREEPLVRDLFLMLFLTGARKSNVMAMRWEDLDLAAGIWNVPDSKNGEPLTLVLSARAVDILRSRMTLGAASPWVFPSSGRTGHRVHIAKAWARIKKAADLPDLRPHDLRRTVGSWLAAEGISLQIIGETLGHKSIDSTLVYAHLHKQPIRDALEKIQDKIRA